MYIHLIHDISWSPRKAAENLRKHGVDFADAAIALEDNDHEEQRFKTPEIGPTLKILYMIHAYRDEDCIRIISARKADHNETEQYYRGINYE